MNAIRLLLFVIGLVVPGAMLRAQDLSVADLEFIAPIVETQIRDGRIPGAVVLVGHRGKVVYRQAFGSRALEPTAEAMTVDTIFDLASLTKAVATTTAVLQLAERRRLNLDAPVSRYWRGFSAHRKGAITIRQLLAHTSGLRADFEGKQTWTGAEAAARRVAGETPVAPPGSRMIYSDLNFLVLGELVRRVSGQPLDAYCRRRIFEPLAMDSTRFLPPESWQARIAPAERADAGLPRGIVHDPTARRMGGVAGHAGLFSTADDLATFAQALLDGGVGHSHRILRRETVAQLMLPQPPAAGPDLRGLGWRAEPPLVANRDELPPAGAIVHFGYTGTALWVDPVTETYLIVLTNRLHARAGDADPLRRQIAGLVGAALGPLPFAQLVTGRPQLARYASLRSDQRRRQQQHRIATGIDVLAADGYSPLRGARIGLITNQTGVGADGRRSIDLLRGAPGVTLAALFSPEHGPAGSVDAAVPSGVDAASGLPVHSLYGNTRRPTPAMLEGLDALVFDIQDAGTRFYTYAATMAYAMEAAAAKGIPFYVLDRPNPIGGAIVQGPMLDADRTSFTAYLPMPVRHGMTIGELARMFNEEKPIGARLTVIPMAGYGREAWFDQTGLPWINPSPNLRSLAAASLYPGVGLIEGANVSVGRGTPTPFQVVGAPWADAATLAAHLNERHIPGVYFLPTHFVPDAGPFRNQACHGVRIVLADRLILDAPALGIELAGALYRLFPDRFRLDLTLGAIGSRQVVEAIHDGTDPRDIAAAWQAPLAVFEKTRARYLIY
jgi:uncharacterized protein YbbC (DUF1343 family)/CubicO group peptidase (beta-lactamase class C family)